ncbi:MAG: hypothetical protein Q7U04_12800 [Bacteriovorax sp.]|nr:hypothetical protein [Bacteriovorax sp.]
MNEKSEVKATQNVQMQPKKPLLAPTPATTPKATEKEEIKDFVNEGNPSTQTPTPVIAKTDK